MVLTLIAATRTRTALASHQPTVVDITEVAAHVDPHPISYAPTFMPEKVRVYALFLFSPAPVDSRTKTSFPLFFFGTLRLASHADMNGCGDIAPLPFCVPRPQTRYAHSFFSSSRVDADKDSPTRLFPCLRPPPPFTTIGGVQMWYAFLTHSLTSPPPPFFFSFLFF